MAPTPAPPVCPDPRVAPSARGRVEVSPIGLARLEAQWRTQAETLTDPDAAAFTGATGESSRTMQALRDTATPAGDTTVAIGRQLAAMADGIRSYRAAVFDTDEQAAAILQRLLPR